MASLVKNGDNYGLIWTDNSRRKSQTRESLKTDDKRVAMRRKSRLENEYFEGNHDPWRRKWYQRPQDPEGAIKLKEAVEEFIHFKTHTKGRQGWSESISVKEAQFMRMFVREVGAELYLSELTTDHLEDFYYRDEVNSDHTRNSYYISVNTFLNWCITKEYLTEKPEYRPKKPQSKTPKFIYPEELARLIEYRLSKAYHDIKSGRLVNPDQAPCWMIFAWLIMAGTGMRRREIANLKISHLTGDFIIIGEDFTTKTRAERHVPLLFEARRAAQVLADPHFRRLDPRLAESDYLLGRSPKSAQNYLSRRFGKCWSACFPNKPKRSLYNLKDMFAVRFLTDPSVPTEEGMKIEDLRKILGHQSLETTQKYLKAIPFGLRLSGTIWDYLPDEPWPLPDHIASRYQHVSI